MKISRNKAMLSNESCYHYDDICLWLEHYSYHNKPNAFIFVACFIPPSLAIVRTLNPDSIKQKPCVAFYFKNRLLNTISPKPCDLN